MALALSFASNRANRCLAWCSLGAFYSAWDVWGVFRRSHGIPARGISGPQALGSEVGSVVGARMVAMVTFIAMLPICALGPPTLLGTSIQAHLVDEFNRFDD